MVDRGFRVRRPLRADCSGPKRKFQCTLQWLMKAENFTKVIQGNYENREQAA